MMLEKILFGNPIISLMSVIALLIAVLLLGIFAMHWLIGGIILMMAMFLVIYFRGNEKIKLWAVGAMLVIGLVIIVFGKGWF